MKISIKLLSEMTGLFPGDCLQRAEQQKRCQPGNRRKDPQSRSGGRLRGGLAGQQREAGDVPRQRGHRQRLAFFSSLISGVEEEGRSFGFDTLIYNLTRDSGGL